MVILTSIRVTVRRSTDDKDIIANSANFAKSYTSTTSENNDKTIICKIG